MSIDTSIHKDWWYGLTPERRALGNEDGVMDVQGKATSRRYSSEFKERAVRMVRQLGEETGERKG